MDGLDVFAEEEVAGAVVGMVVVVAAGAVVVAVVAEMVGVWRGVGTAVTGLGFGSGGVIVIVGGEEYGKEVEKRSAVAQLVLVLSLAMAEEAVKEGHLLDPFAWVLTVMGCRPALDVNRCRTADQNRECSPLWLPRHRLRSSH